MKLLVHSPYCLAYLQETNRIAVTGDKALLKHLAFFPGAKRHRQPLGFEYMSIPASRLAVLALEALATPESVGASYKDYRAGVMTQDLTSYNKQVAVMANATERQLLPHQKEFCALTLENGNMLNGSEQGTGKTTASWMSAWLNGARRVLILCPKTLVDEWRNDLIALFGDNPPYEFLSLAEGLTVDRRTRLEAFSKKDSGSLAVAVNFEVIADVKGRTERKGLKQALIDYAPDALLIDESWRLKNPAASVTKAVQSIREATNPAFVTEAAGTPIGRNVGDLWSQIKLLDPDAMPLDHWEFIRKFAKVVKIKTGPGSYVNKIEGCTDPLGLMQFLAPYWFRATKETCLNLPPKQYRDIYLDLPLSARQLYNDVREYGEYALGAELSTSSAGVITLRLQQLASGILPVPTLYATGEVEKWTSEPYIDPKLEWLKQWVVDNLSDHPDARLIVWSRFTLNVLRIEEELGKIVGRHRVASVYGQNLKQAQLNAIKDSFNSKHPDGCQIISAQIKKLAYGHNLQACDYNIYYSHSWDYIERAQSEDRSHRYGRADGVRYINLITRATVDEDIQQAMRERRSLSEQLLVGTVAGDGDE